MSFFSSGGIDSIQSGLYVAGSLSPRLVNNLYPMEALTKWHAANHIAGITGSWMDKGGTYLAGQGGNWHRLYHGHHLFEDGFKVLTNPKLKFGEFLHHLGLDSLTTRGIVNPLVPTTLAEPLMSLGLSKSFVHEIMTINVPKILSGSLGVICAGRDVYMCFSDAIPHTYLASGVHFLFGGLQIGLGMYPPNALLLASGVAEIGVGSVTLYRTVCDSLASPSASVLTDLVSPVYLPVIGGSLAMGAILGGAAGWWTGTSWQETAKGAATAGLGSAASATVGMLVAKAGLIAPFLGAGAGIATALLVRAALRSADGADKEELVSCGKFLGNSVFSDATTFPLFKATNQPIGRIEGDTLKLDHRSLSNEEENNLRQ
ncbi:MAG: hypothetical protein ABGW78_10885 [Pirellulales bacterium]